MNEKIKVRKIIMYTNEMDNDIFQPRDKSQNHASI